MRFNHMELTFARGALNERDPRRHRLASTATSWTGGAAPYELFGQIGHLLVPDDGQFILLMEVDEPIQSPELRPSGPATGHPRGGRRHPRGLPRSRRRTIGWRCRSFDDIVTPRVTQHAFYVRYLLPIWFDVCALEYPPGGGPAKQLALHRA